MPVSEFMAHALYHPRHGYYMSGGEHEAGPIGAQGDFVTAPEISQMFGELIGLCLADFWLRAGRPSAIDLIELGPGRGTLMADLLRAAAGVPGFGDALQVHLVEISPALQAVQRQCLEGHAVTWHSELTAAPRRGPLLVVANEFFDALPMRQFMRRPDGGWSERLVGWDAEQGALAFTQDPAVSPSAALIDPALRGAPLDEVPAGTIVEQSPMAVSAARDIAERIAEQPMSAALLIDYGYAGRPESWSTGDTLQALRRHRPVSPLAAPGWVDLTAHVDFSSLSQTCRAAGAAVQGPVPQGAFLGALGIAARAERLKANATADQAMSIERAMARLIDAEQMGTLFKVLGAHHRDAPALGGFEVAVP
ncbi:MAG: SAM-dependent methyltransferase [Alphaproteobacteria bacterium]|nr:SAM-dependent methyltransferase [Alphaproteobacteria bacterium]